jgi:hypothetical protein
MATTFTTSLLRTSSSVIISPFDEEGTSSYTPTDPVELQEEFLDLTMENVEQVLDEMRPYLIQVGTICVFEKTLLMFC